MKTVEQLQRQIDFLHSLLNDEQDELYPALPPPPPTPVDPTAVRSGELVARYSTWLEVLETPHHSIVFEERIDKSCRKNLQAFLKAAGLLDKKGQLISDGNEQLRQHFRDWMAEDKTRRGQDFPFQQFEEQLIHSRPRLWLTSCGMARRASLLGNNCRNFNRISQTSLTKIQKSRRKFLNSLRGLLTQALISRRPLISLILQGLSLMPPINAMVSMSHRA